MPIGRGGKPENYVKDTQGPARGKKDLVEKSKLPHGCFGGKGPTTEGKGMSRKGHHRGEHENIGENLATGEWRKGDVCKVNTTGVERGGSWRSAEGKRGLVFKESKKLKCHSMNGRGGRMVFRKGLLSF